MNEKHPDVNIATLADPTEMADRSGGMLARGQAEEAGEMAARGEAGNVSDQGDQRGRGQKADSWNRTQAGDNVDLFAERLELRLHQANSAVQFPDFLARLTQKVAQRSWNGNLGIIDPDPDVGCHSAGPDGNHQAELPENPLQGVDPGSAGGQPARAKPVQCGECLLFDRLDGDRSDRLIACRFEQRLGVGRVGLACATVTGDILGGQELDIVTQTSELTSPVVGRSACLHEHKARRRLAHEARQLTSRQSTLLADATGVMGDGELEGGLDQVDGKHDILRGGLLLVLRT
jgi:hypothetical protein